MKLRGHLLIIFMLLCAALAGAACYVLHQPYAAFEGDIFVEIKLGTRTAALASMLRDRGVVRHEWLFLATRALRRKDALQAGEYKFHQPASVWEVYDRIARGDVHYYELRIPEGNNIYDISRIVEELGFVTAEEFLEVAQKPALIQDLAPEAPTLEGYLFPSTYKVTRYADAATICRMMTNQFRQVWGSLDGEADVRETVTLASLVEKETGVPHERPQIASVFHNRLRRGIKLDCDPTTIYAAILEGVYDGVIHRSDLDRRHPYNTYLNPGLPPGPIANPGREALRATLQPDETDYLFFVAKPDGSGEHVFSKTMAAHSRAVANYRRGTR